MNCQYINENEQCKAYAMKGASYCYMHNPNISEQEKREAQARGGSKLRVEGRKISEPIELAETKDVLVLLNDTVNRVRAGSMSTKTANTLGYLATVYLRAYEVTELERRVRELEQKEQERG